jgi:hypothetical protein
MGSIGQHYVTYKQQDNNRGPIARQVTNTGCMLSSEFFCKLWDAVSMVHGI